jgi:hypothetical protein
VHDALEVSAVHSLAGFNLADELITRPPYSDPHHSASVASIVGGGQRMAKPGAISCAHKGVLFLDESTDAQSIRQRRVIPACRHGATGVDPYETAFIRKPSARVVHDSTLQQRWSWLSAVPPDRRPRLASHYPPAASVDGCNTSKPTGRYSAAHPASLCRLTMADVNPSYIPQAD